MADFRSDTITVADARMREAMASAAVGDDFYGEDPTVAALEAAAAALVGKPAGLFVPNGTLANTVAMLALTVGDQVVVHADSDIQMWEAHTMAKVAHLQTLPLPGARGRLDLDALRRCLSATDPYAPRPGVVAIENTHSASGGSAWSLAEIAAVADLCAAHGVPLYCDGARLFNAVVARGYTAAQATSRCAAVAISLYKGLGAPMGSVLCGAPEFIDRARTLRRTLGLTFRQVGHVAAAGLVALENVASLADDHRRARLLWEQLDGVLPADVLGDPPETNILALRFGADAAHVVDLLAAQGVRVTEVVPGVVRFVTHRDLDDDAVTAAVVAMRSVLAREVR
ncbi:threonine aldolase family protein [Micromonospora sp. DT31]|uniref:threonine aldolase family protein n=1 Tax=Micromonospora sp. DT31 TaxID=3393434 RepID=UPI003CF70F8A